MTDILDTIKEKYAEEIGWSFTFFEWVTFVAYLISINIALCASESGVWGNLLTKSLNDIIFGDESILLSARVIDYLLSALLTIFTVYGYRKFRHKSYEYLSTLKNLDTYVDGIKSKYRIGDVKNQALRLYIANNAYEQKRLHMAKITTINGFGLISLGMVGTSLIGFVTPNLTDFLVIVSGLVSLFLVQWVVFARYTSQVIPHLVLERLARGEDVQFGDELHQ